MKKSTLEHRIQASVVAWARKMQKARPELGLLYAVHNQGTKDARRGAWMKAEGTLAGIPDLCLPVGRGRLSKAQ